MNQPSNNYQIFMLRIWTQGMAQARGLRLSIEDPHTRERIGFGTLEEFLDYLQKSYASFLSDG